MGEYLHRFPRHVVPTI